MELEQRFYEFEVREDGNVIEGTAIRYGDQAVFGDFKETFEPRSLVFDDVILNLQHQRTAPVARTGAGLVLTDSASALSVRATFPDTTFGRQARELVQARILRGFSLEFRALQDQWSGQHRTVKRARLYGIGLVDIPAYPASVIAERMAQLMLRRRMVF